MAIEQDIFCNLRNVATVLMGQSPPSAACGESVAGLPFLQGNAEFKSRYPKHRLNCDSPTRICEPGDMLVSVRAPVGEVNQADRRYVIGRGLAAVRFPNDASGFGWHTLRFWCRDLEKIAQGSTFTAVGRKELEELRISYFSPEQNHFIAKVLDSVDEAIAKTEAVIAKMRQIRAGLLHDLLTRGLDKNGQIRDRAVHPEQFRDSPLGRLPRKWQLLRLENASVKVQDGTHFSPKSTSGPRRYVTSKNIRFGFLDLTDCGWISEAEHREIYKRCDVQKHDILLTKDGANTGNATLNILDEEFSLLSSVALIRCRRGLSHYDFLLNYLISPLGQKRLKDMMSGNAITRLTLQKIKNFVIPLPPFDEQINIAEQLRACGDSIVSIENELVKLTKIESGFMSDLLTGRVRVPEGII